MSKNIFSLIIITLFITYSCKSKKEEIEPFHTVKVESIDEKQELNDNNPTQFYPEDLPVNAKDFIQTQFSEEKIQSVVKENDSSGEEYKVQLSRGIQIEFDQNGDWKEVKSVLVNQSLKTDFLPNSILNYLSSNYSKLKVKGVEKDQKGYEISFLQQNFELKFDLNGNFMKKDNK